MFWQLSNGNFLINTKTYNLSDYTTYFHSAAIKSVLEDKVLDGIGHFIEIKTFGQFISIDDIKSHLSEIIVESEREKSLKIGNRTLGEVVKTFGSPIVSSLDDYLYLTGLYLVETNKFVEYFISEKTYQGFFGEIKETIVYDNLEMLYSIYCSPLRQS